MRVWFALLTTACFPVTNQPSQPTQQVQGPPGAGDPWRGTAEAAPEDPPPSFAPMAPEPPRAAPPATPPAAPSRPAPPAPRQPRISDDAQAFVDAHNADRAKHCAGPLTWSTKLADAAQRWANTLRDDGCKFGHSGGQYGENLAAGTQGMLDPGAVVAMWYDEVKDYSFSSGGFSMQTGHFTQLVWRKTTQVGCGHSQCNGNDIYVCEYDPPGNFEGEYRENVLPTTCNRR